jgi:hypothetical protein
MMQVPSCQTGCSAPTSDFALRIGVTGHRDLAAEKVPTIEEKVRGVLDRMERVLKEASARLQVSLAPNPIPHRQRIAWIGERIDTGLTELLRRVWPAVPANPQNVPDERQTSFRWIMVSPLAKGADRIVARAVLERHPHPNALPEGEGDEYVPRLEVVLPMPLEQYLQDFKDAADRQEFDELYAKASWTNEADEFVPTDVDSGFGAGLLTSPNARPEVSGSAGSGDPRTTGLLRNAAYQMGGRKVVNRCDVLIAIWDGQPADAAGGTGDIVPYAILQGRPVLWINSAHPEAPVTLLTKTHSPSAKRWPTTDDDDPMRGVYIDEFPTRAKQISLGFHRLAAFQRDPAIDPLPYASKLADKQTELEMELRKFNIDAAARTIGQTILPPMLRADLLAERYQLLHRRSVVYIYSLALLAVVVAVAQQVFWPEHHWVIAFEVLALLAAWGLLRVNRRERWQEKYLNDRYLAEWLRRAQFEVLLPPASQSNSNVGTKTAFDRCTATPAVGQVELYHGPETWFVDTFQRVTDRAARQIHCDGDATVAATPLPTLRDALLKAWIEPQAEWHTTKARKQHQKAKMGQRMTFGLFAATLVFATIHLLFGHILEGAIGGLVALLAIVLPAAAATLHAIERFFHHERTADRSEQMARQLRRLADRVRAAESEDELRQAVREVDALMAREVEEWWIAGNLHRPAHPV